MAEQLSMTDILSDEKPVEVTPEPAKEPVVEPAAKEPVERPVSLKQVHRDKEQDAQGRVRDPETGQYATKEVKVEEKVEVKVEPKVEVKPVVAPQQEFTEKEKAFLKAAQEERTKRQHLENRLKEMEAKLPKEPDKTFWDDPEAALKRQKDEIHQAIVGSRLQTSEAIARGRHKDFDQKIATFTELAQTTPGLAQQMMADPDPAEFVYRTATNHQALKEAGGMDAMRKKIEDETRIKVRAELEKELADKAEALAKERAALPGSLSEVTSKGVNRPTWSGVPSMAEILKG